MSHKKVQIKNKYKKKEVLTQLRVCKLGCELEKTLSLWQNNRHITVLNRTDCRQQFFGSSYLTNRCCTSVFPVKSFKTEDPRQTGTESRSTGRDTVSSVPPESRRWVPPTLIKEYGLIEEAQKDAVFRKVSCKAL